jgi:OOP family OmpA-OmpF porin
MKYAVLGVAALALASCGNIKELEEQVGTLKGDLAKVQADTDGDGVSDAFDLEANTPKGALVDGSGRALDLDGDGIRHELDTDPFTQRGARVDASGRELDSDGDGVMDSKDMEPNTPAGALVNFQGKKIEGTVTTQVAEAFIPEVHFATNSASVSVEDEAKLAVVAKMMKTNPSLRLRVVGHADATGSERVNLKVGERRAKAVVRVLTTTFGISEARFEVVSKGESELLSKKNVHNRRVEFQFIQ